MASHHTVRNHINYRPRRTGMGGVEMAEDHERDGTDGPSVPLLGVTSLREGHVVVQRFTGEIDSLTAPQLSDALAGVDPDADLVVDLTEVRFLSSAGLSVLVDHLERCRARDVTFSVVATSHATLRPIQITALDRVIPLYPSVTDAVKAAGQTT